MKQQLQETVEVPEGVTVTYENKVFTAKGPQGEVSRTIYHPKILIRASQKEITFDVPVATQREKRQAYTLRAHIRNVLRGVTEKHVYKLKICSGHFPMNVSLSNGVFTVKNFLGEAVPRTLKLKKGVDVKLDGDIIEVSSVNIELAGSQASDIEQLTRITNRDRRIFQDGIFIIQKDGVEL
ncbi:MAG: 50S ribosomal protein L6 [Candidatus Woesearchaeota archaeon]